MTLLMGDPFLIFAVLEYFIIIPSLVIIFFANMQKFSSLSFGVLVISIGWELWLLELVDRTKLRLLSYAGFLLILEFASYFFL